MAFLDKVTDSDAALQTFLQRMLGYALTGLTRDHALFFLYGLGANGKSVLLNTVTGQIVRRSLSYTLRVTEKDPKVEATPLSKLFASWKNWCEQNGEHPGGSRALSQKLTEQGLRSRRVTQGMVFIGLKVTG
jgi:phage/plasmid-associated DNA primase